MEDDMEVEVERSRELAVDLKGRAKIKSASRMRYEAEVRFLRQQNGELEQIRQKLGLYRRKIAQLLLVDPSAWTRWTTKGSDAPPHIYQALDWYLSILEKDPEYRRLATRFANWLNREKDHEGRLSRLESEVDSTPHQQWRGFAALILAFLGGVFFSYF